MKKNLVLILTLLLSLSLFAEENIAAENYVLKNYKFNESWGYVIQGHEKDLHENMMITDLSYFSADIDCYGRIPYIPKRDDIKNYKGRVHLVITCNSYSLSHFVLDPKYGVRNGIIKTIVEASKDYDGIQIDFETVPKEDNENFYQFLKILKKKLKGKTFSVCVPARLKTLENDIFDYQKMCTVADKVFVMAYDQHWSTSRPGPIAGMSWCEQICDYALTVIPKEKLVMGLPFYGRSWQNESYGKAWLYSGVERILKENKVSYSQIKREDEVPYVKFNTNVKVTMWFDDAQSLASRCKMYENKGVENVGFWRIGQEDQKFWEAFE